MRGRIGPGINAPATSSSLSLGGLLPSRIPESTGTNYYVSTTGNDTTGDGSIGSPWLTMQKALDTVSLTGSIINMRGGTYVSAGNETRWTRQGGSTNPVTVQNYPGETVIIDQSRILVYHATNQPSYLRIKGLTVRNAGASVEDNIKIEGQANNIEVVGCTVHGADKQGVNIQTTSGHGNNIQVWDCIIHTNGNTAHGNLDHGLYWGHSGSNCVLANCLFYNNCAYNLQVYPDANGIIVANCTFDDGMAHAQARGGMVLGTEAQGVDNTVIVGVISTNADGYGFDVYNGGGGSQVNNNAYDCIGYNDTSGSFNTGAGGLLAYTNCSTVDPLYVNAGTRNYHLQSSSPAISKIQSARYGYVPVLDIEGNARVTADAGCYRYV